VSTSALAALTASAPSVPFVGPAVLGDLFGRPSAIPIAIGGLVINLTVVPVDGEFQNGRGIRGLADLDTITEMRDFLVLLLHLIVTIARLVKPERIPERGCRVRPAQASTAHLEPWPQAGAELTLR
jgi:hypothetical protein